MEEEHSVDKEVSAVVYDSRKIVEGCLFICIEGVNFDGHAFAAEAAEKGAAALLVSKPVEGLEDKDIAVIKVEDTRYAMAFVSAAWFGHPAKKLKTIGITGTKGKTTTTYLVKSILENAGLKVGLIGTIETVIGDVHIHAENTTPESYILQEYFAKMAEAGLDTVVMEVSSQALKLHRTQGFVFDYGIFTNLEPDHIGPGEHESFEEYMECKGRLFRQCLVGIANCDDNHVGDIVEGHSCELETYGTGEGAMLACNSFPKVLCGHIESPLDAYLFSQVNDGNCVALPFAENFGWGGELNLQYIFEKLFCAPGGGGYPPERVEPEQRNKKILDKVKEVTHTDMVTILKNLDRELVKGALSGAKFREYFFENCKCGKIAEAVKEVLE